MAEKLEITIAARVFHVEPVARPGPRRMLRGWYYQFEGDEPEGPYGSQMAAGAAAREVILGHARGLAWRNDGARVEVEPAAGEDTLRVTITGRPEKRAAGDRRTELGEHYAGSDRRMRDRRGRKRIDYAAAAAALPPIADRPLDRTHGRNKYAVVNMREVMAIDDGIDGTSTRGAAVINAINTLRHYGVLNDGDPKTRGEFFVLMLKDEFSDVALLRYAEAARAAGMVEYADDVLQLTLRAGHGSPWCKRPD